MQKKYAFVNHGGQVMYIENRCSGYYKADVQQGELSIEDIVHESLIHYYIEIPDGVEVYIGMIYSDGKFTENPLRPQKKMEILQKQQEDTNQAVLGIMNMLNTK